MIVFYKFKLWRSIGKYSKLSASSKGYQCVIIGTTHLRTKFNSFWTKYCCPLSNILGKGQLFILPRQHRHIHKHILQKDSVARGGIIDEDMRYRADELTVLDNR